MKTRNIFIVMGFLVGMFCHISGNAQNDTLKNKPQIKVNVNIQKDENGNIVSYDSSYVETWSSTGTNEQDFLNDSPFFDFPQDSVFNHFFSFPDFDKLDQEMMNQMKLFDKLFHFPQKNSENSKPIKKEKISLNTTNI